MPIVAVTLYEEVLNKEVLIYHKTCPVFISMSFISSFTSLVFLYTESFMKLTCPYGFTVEFAVKYCGISLA